jgi:hypothetical protein
MKKKRKKRKSKYNSKREKTGLQRHCSLIFHKNRIKLISWIK